MQSGRVLCGNEEAVLFAVWVLDCDPGLLQGIRVADSVLEPRVSRDSEAVAFGMNRGWYTRQVSADCVLTVNEAFDFLDIGLE